MRITEYDQFTKTNEALGHIEALIKQDIKFSVSYKLKTFDEIVEDHLFIVITEETK